MEGTIPKGIEGQLQKLQQIRNKTTKSHLKGTMGQFMPQAP